MPKRKTQSPLGIQITLVAFCMLSFWTSIATIITGNMWVREETIGDAFAKQYGNRVRVLSFERHVWRASRVVLEHENGQKILYESTVISFFGTHLTEKIKAQSAFFVLSICPFREGSDPSCSPCKP